MKRDAGETFLVECDLPQGGAEITKEFPLGMAKCTIKVKSGGVVRGGKIQRSRVFGIPTNLKDM